MKKGIKNLLLKILVIILIVEFILMNFNVKELYSADVMDGEQLSANNDLKDLNRENAKHTFFNQGNANKEDFHANWTYGSAPGKYTNIFPIKSGLYKFDFYFQYLSKFKDDVLKQFYTTISEPSKKLSIQINIYRENRLLLDSRTFQIVTDEGTKIPNSRDGLMTSWEVELEANKIYYLECKYMLHDYNGNDDAYYKENLEIEWFKLDATLSKILEYEDISFFNGCSIKMYNNQGNITLNGIVYPGKGTSIKSGSANTFSIKQNVSYLSIARIESGKKYILDLSSENGYKLGVVDVMSSNYSDIKNIDLSKCKKNGKTIEIPSSEIAKLTGNKDNYALILMPDTKAVAVHVRNAKKDGVIYDTNYQEVMYYMDKDGNVVDGIVERIDLNKLTVEDDYNGLSISREEFTVNDVDATEETWFGYVYTGKNEKEDEDMSAEDFEKKYLSKKFIQPMRYGMLGGNKKITISNGNSPGAINIFIGDKHYTVAQNSSINLYLNGYPEGEENSYTIKDLLSGPFENVYILPDVYDSKNDNIKLTRIKDADKITYEFSNNEGTFTREGQYTIKVEVFDADNSLVATQEQIDASQDALEDGSASTPGSSGSSGDSGSSSSSGTSLNIKLPGSNQSEQTDGSGPIEVDEMPGIGSSILNGLVHGFGSVIEALINAIFSIGGVAAPTIDGLVYNTYEPTKITYFYDNSNNDNDNDNSIAGKIAGKVTDFYKTFVGIAVVTYLFILIYTGIRILISATAAEKSRYKQMLQNWMIGLIMLFFFQYVMMFVIQLNDAIIGVFSGNSNGSSNNEVASIQNDYKEVGKACWYKDKDGTVKQKGNTTYSAIWVILLAKTCILVLFYFKRLLIVTALIIVFPLITITYALDKMNDGKSQVFNAWFSEFMLNVLIQALQALVFTVIMSVANALSGSIFALFAVLSFDEIAEKIIVFFGLKSGAGMYKGIAGSALQFSALKSMVTNSAGKVIGGAKAVAGGVGERIQISRENKLEPKIKKSGEGDVSILKNKNTANNATASQENTTPKVTAPTKGVAAATTGVTTADKTVTGGAKTALPKSDSTNNTLNQGNTQSDDYEMKGGVYLPKETARALGKDDNQHTNVNENENISENENQNIDTSAVEQMPEAEQYNKSTNDAQSSTRELTDEEIEAKIKKISSTNDMIKNAAEMRKRKAEANKKIASGLLKMGASAAAAPGAVLFGAGMGKSVEVATTAMDFAGWNAENAGKIAGGAIARGEGYASAQKENNKVDADKEIESMLGIDGTDLHDEDRQNYINAVKKARKTASVTGNETKALNDYYDKAPSRYKLRNKAGDRYAVQEKTYLSSGTRTYSVKLDKLGEDALRGNSYSQQSIEKTVKDPDTNVVVNKEPGNVTVKQKVTNAQNIDTNSFTQLLNNINWNNAARVDEFRNHINKALDSNGATVSKIELNKDNNERIEATLKFKNKVNGEINVEFDKNNFNIDNIKEISNAYQKERSNGKSAVAAKNEVNRQLRKIETNGIQITSARKGTK